MYYLTNQIFMKRLILLILLMTFSIALLAQEKPGKNSIGVQANIAFLQIDLQFLE